VTNNGSTARQWLGLSMVLVAFAGCAVTDPTLYYSLGQTTTGSSTAGAESRVAAPGPGTRVAGAEPLSIGVGPVIVPGYLERAQIVTRSGPDRVKLATFHRWAEPLENGVARILADEIGARVPTDRVVTFPWRGIVARAIQYQVVVAVDR